MHFYKELFSVAALQLSELLSDDLAPWISYIAKEYYFLYKCAFDLSYRNSYVDAINVPTLREEYIRLHHERFLETFGNEAMTFSEENIFTSSIITSAAEFQLMDTFAKYSETLDFDQTFSPVFRVRMDLLGVEKRKQEQYIQKGFAIGKEIFSRDPSLMDIGAKVETTSALGD